MLRPEQLNELWLGDSTSIPTGEGWLYMSSVLDACSRRLLGWSLAGHMRTELVTDASKQPSVNAAALATGRHPSPTQHPAHAFG